MSGSGSAGPTECTSTSLVTSRASEKLLVVKVPRFLMEHLQRANSSSGGAARSLGTVTENAASSSTSAMAPPGVTRSYTLTLPDDLTPEGMPSEFEMHCNAAGPPMYVLSRSDGGGNPAHEGRVEAKGELRPKRLTADYRALLKERAQRADQPLRTMGIIADDSELKRKKLGHRQILDDERAARVQKVERRERNTAKKARMEVLSAREMKERLKALFSRQTYWSRVDLMREVGNEKVLKECLEELCVKETKKGPHYNDYSLRPSLRTGLPAPSRDARPDGP